MLSAIAEIEPLAAYTPSQYTRCALRGSARSVLALNGRFQGGRTAGTGRVHARWQNIAVDLAHLRPCPFCAHDQPIVAAVERDQVEGVTVLCSECGAVGPMATATDPLGHAQQMWNSRFGVQ